MKLATSLSAALLLSVASAAPSLKNKLSKRAGYGPSSSPQESINYSGLFQFSSGITQVAGTITIPGIVVPPGGNSGTVYYGSAWVGIGGNDCGELLQTGVQWSISNGEVTYNAFFEWLPASQANFNLAVHTGDVLSLKVVATSTTSGTAYITNETTGQSVQHDFSGQQALCQGVADWIVEDVSVNGADAPFAGYGQVQFTDASFVHDGTTSGLTGGSSTLLYIEQNGETLSSCTVNSGSELTCKYQ